MLTRREDWPERLAEWIAGSRDRAFAWGEHDCALAVADAIVATTGVDVAGFMRGQYADAAGLDAILAAKYEGKLERLIESIAATHGIVEVLPRQAQRGDVIVFDGQHGPTVGFVGMDGLNALAVAPRGMLAVPVRVWRRAWRIG